MLITVGALKGKKQNSYITLGALNGKCPARGFGVISKQKKKRFSFNRNLKWAAQFCYKL